MKIIPEREELLICDQYSANWPLKKIAAYANLSQSTIMCIVKRRGIPLRAGKKVSKEQERQVVELYLKGLPISEVSDQSGVRSEQTIYRILHDAKVRRRRNTKSPES